MYTYKFNHTVLVGSHEFRDLQKKWSLMPVAITHSLPDDTLKQFNKLFMKFFLIWRMLLSNSKSLLNVFCFRYRMVKHIHKQWTSS